MYESGQVFAPECRICWSRWTTILPCLQGPESAAKPTQQPTHHPPRARAHTIHKEHHHPPKRFLATPSHHCRHIHPRAFLATMTLLNRSGIDVPAARNVKPMNADGNLGASARGRRLLKFFYDKYSQFTKGKHPLNLCLRLSILAHGCRRQLTRTLRPALLSTTPSATRRK